MPHCTVCEGASGASGEIPLGESDGGVGHEPHGNKDEGAPEELGNDEPQGDVAGDNNEVGGGVTRPQRTRQPPAWLDDYETGDYEGEDE